MDLYSRPRLVKQPDNTLLSKSNGPISSFRLELKDGELVASFVIKDGPTVELATLCKECMKTMRLINNIQQFNDPKYSSERNALREKINAVLTTHKNLEQSVASHVQVFMGTYFSNLNMITRLMLIEILYICSDRLAQQ